MVGADGTAMGSGVPRQICFTRVGKQEAGAGWQTVNVSPGLPAGTVSAFEGIQNGNTGFITTPEFDAEDTAQIVTELRTQGRDAFLTRIKYGVREEVGRPAMGAQGFVFPLDQLVADPQSVLNVEYANFALAADQTQTAQIVQATASAPATFAMAPHRSKAELRADLGLLGLGDDQRFADLLECVMITLFSRAKDTLTVYCDCSETTIRTVMAALYEAVPPALRGRLTFSTYLTISGSPTTVVFAHPGRVAARTFDLASGETNVLTKSARHRYKQYEFMISPAYRFNDRNDPLPGFFEALENKVIQLGDNPGTADLDMYQLAYDLGEQSGKSLSTYEACVDRLFKLVPLARLDRMNEYVEHLIAEALNMFVALSPREGGRLQVNNAVDEQVGEALGKAKTDELIKTGDRYKAEVIKAKTPEEGAWYLATRYPDRTAQGFLNIRARLAKDAAGQTVLRELYVTVLGEQLKTNVDQEAATTDADLISGIAAYRDEAFQWVTDRAAVMQVVADAAQSYLVARVQPDQDPGEVVRNTGSVLDQLLPNGPLSDNAWQAVVESYWKRFTFKDFKFDQVPSPYEPLGDTAYPEYAAIGYAQQCLQAFNAGDVSQVAAELQRYRDVVGLDPDKRVTLNKLMLQYCWQHRNQYAARPIAPTGNEYQPQGAEAQSAAELDVWISLIRTLTSNAPKTVAELLLRQGMLPTAEQERFFELVDGSTLLGGEDSPELGRLRDGMQQCADSGDPALVEGAKSVLEELDALDKRREQERKQRVKEAKAAEKEARKAERKQRGGLFGGLFGGGSDESEDDGAVVEEFEDRYEEAAPEAVPSAPVAGYQPESISPRSDPRSRSTQPATPQYQTAPYAQPPASQQSAQGWVYQDTSRPHDFDFNRSSSQQGTTAQQPAPPSFTPEQSVHRSQASAQLPYGQPVSSQQTPVQPAVPSAPTVQQPYQQQGFQQPIAPASVAQPVQPQQPVQPTYEPHDDAPSEKKPKKVGFFRKLFKK